MHLNIVPAKTGLRWARLGVRTFMRQPIALTGLFFMFVALLTVASLVPVVGSALALVFLPAATLGMMAASRETASGRFARPAVLFSAFRAGAQQRVAMLKLGVVYAAGFLLALGLSALFDGGIFARAYLFGGSLDREVLMQPGVQAAMWLVLAFYAPLSILFWHAPALAYWYRVSPAKSLFFSAVACLRNFGAFIVYGLAWAAIFVIAGIVVSLFATLLVIGAGGADGDAPPVVSALATGLMTGSALVLATAFFSSLYFTFVDCFVHPDEMLAEGSLLGMGEEAPAAEREIHLPD